MQLDKQNSDELPSVTLVDIGGNYDQPNACCRRGINNLFDKTYVGACYDITIAGWGLSVKCRSA